MFETGWHAQVAFAHRNIPFNAFISAFIVHKEKVSKTSLTKYYENIGGQASKDAQIITDKCHCLTPPCSVVNELKKC